MAPRPAVPGSGSGAKPLLITPGRPAGRSRTGARPCWAGLKQFQTPQWTSRSLSEKHGKTGISPTKSAESICHIWTPSIVDQVFQRLLRGSGNTFTPLCQHCGRGRLPPQRLLETPVSSTSRDSLAGRDPEINVFPTAGETAAQRFQGPFSCQCRPACRSARRSQGSGTPGPALPRGGLPWRSPDPAA